MCIKIQQIYLTPAPVTAIIDTILTIIESYTDHNLESEPWPWARHNRLSVKKCTRSITAGVASENAYFNEEKYCKDYSGHRIL